PERPLRLAGGAPVLQELERRVPDQQAHLAQGGAGDTDSLAELVAVEPGAGLVREREPEDVVVEADRRVEILDGDTDVMESLHRSSLESWATRRASTRCSDKDLPAVHHVHL